MPKFTMTDTVYLNTFRKTLLELKKKDHNEQCSYIDILCRISRRNLTQFVLR